MNAYVHVQDTNTSQDPFEGDWVDKTLEVSLYSLPPPLPLPPPLHSPLLMHVIQTRELAWYEREREREMDAQKNTTQYRADAHTCTHTRAHLDARTCRSTFRSSWQSSTRIAASTIFKNPTRPTLVACLCVGGCGLRRGHGRWRRRRRWEGVVGVRSYACTFLHSYPPAPLCTDLSLYTTHTRTHTHVHACTHTHTRACMHACMHTHI